MELISAYIYNSAPIQMTNISRTTLERLEKMDWFADERVPARFKIIGKRFLIDDVWYRVMLRFKIKGDLLELDTPVPFMVFKCEKTEVRGGMHEISIRFKDLHVWHGKEVGSTIGFVQQGVPLKLINAVVDDLKACVIYEGAVAKNVELVYKNNLLQSIIANTDY